MSNLEATPSETLCAAEPGTAGLELIEPRSVPLGGLRSMTVRRTLPQKKRSFIGAWCFLDHYGPDDVSVTGGMNVPAHPHTGLQTVSWLFSGEIEHRDSAGFHAMVRPGELNLMTAGHGISHSERSTAETTLLHGAQLWVALPQRARRTPKTFAHYVPPLARGVGWQGQVFLGALLGEHSPVETHSALVGAEIRLEAGTVMQFAVDPRFEHGLLVDVGSVHLGPSVKLHTETRAATLVGDRDGGSPPDSIEVLKDHLAYVAPGVETVRISAGPEGARVLFIGGEPLGEQIVMWWNFIASSHEEIVQARADWQAQLAAEGVGDPSGGMPIHAPSSASSGRFGLPAGEPEPPLPAPKLPLARLKPR